jgi:hypothetical protein
MKTYKNFKEVNQTCKADEYYCNTDQKCKPIPFGYKVDDKGILVQEDAPANSVGGGNIAGVGVGPAGEPGVMPGKKKKNPIMGMLKRKVQENNDNNNIVLKQVLDALDKTDLVIDNMNQPKQTEIKIIKEQPKKSFKEKYKIK